MKEGKTIEVTVLIIVLVLVVAGLGYKAVKDNGDHPSQSAQTKAALADLKNRIGQLEVLKQEQTLTRDIMVLQQEINQLNLKAQAMPRTDKLPPQTQKQD